MPETIGPANLSPIHQDCRFAQQSDINQDRGPGATVGKISYRKVGDARDHLPNIRRSDTHSGRSKDLQDTILAVGVGEASQKVSNWTTYPKADAGYRHVAEQSQSFGNGGPGEICF